MSQVQTRKRPAPGSSPIQTAPIQVSSNQSNASLKQGNAQIPMATSQYLQWPESNLTTYPDPSANHESTPYNGTPQSRGLPTTSSGQLARASMGQELVSRHNLVDGNNEAWPILTDGVGQSTNGSLLNSEDDLDRRAELAKQQTQAKRKQIPPFVQKLSR